MITAMKVWPQVGCVDQSGGKRRISTRRRLTLGGATLAICSMLAIGMASEAPLVLYPITPSLPSGFYVRSIEPPTVGAIAAFPVPEAARRYKISIGETVHDDFLFMKPIVAGTGDHVCIRPEDGIYVNSILIAPVTMHDRSGRSLPRWRGCRHMAEGEIFALSAYVANSFDSRQFGPIRSSQIWGTYLPLVKFPRLTRNSTSQHCRSASRR